MHSQLKSLFIIKLFTDLAVIIASLVGVQIYFGLTTFSYNGLMLIFGLLGIWLISSNVTRLYDDFRANSFLSELQLTIKNIFVQTVSTITLLFFLRETEISRLFTVVYPLLILFLLTIKKIAINYLLDYVRSHGRNLRNLLIVGAGEVGVNFYYLIKNNPHFGYRIVGFLDDGDKDYQNDEYLGSTDKLDEILENKRVDDVVITLPSYAVVKIDEVVRICERHTTRIKIVPDYFEHFNGKYTVSLFGQFPIISVRPDKVNELHWRVLKRLFDILFCIGASIFLFSWLWPILVLAVKISSPGPVFFKQKRWGRNRKEIYVYKFRSMSCDSKDVDSKGKYQQATKNDPRITKIGAFLRKTNLDELPQFINVFKGEMSLVGPRPHPIPLDLESREVVDYYMQRQLVKPGITGWAQVNGLRGETKTTDVMQKRINLDLWYIDNWSFWLDIQIIFLTVWNTFIGDENAY